MPASSLPARATAMAQVRAWSPGRVNLIGEHTDYNGGLAMPMAIDLGTEATFSADSDERGLPAQGNPGVIEVASADAHGVLRVPVDVPADPDMLRSLEPSWARYAAGIVAMVRPERGGQVNVSSTLPIAAGLSSSAALEVALALALGFEGSPRELALTCQMAEQAASGVPSGVMDQLCVASGIEGAALLIDFSDLSVEPVPLPEGTEVVVVHSGEARLLDRSAYASRRAECEAASFHLGPLGSLSPGEVSGLPDPLLRRRARHVTTECERVRALAEAFRRGDLVEAGRIMSESHESLAKDFEVSTPRLDELVGRLAHSPGVYGARLTGAGFGGCAVALCEPGALDPAVFPDGTWRVKPSAGATIVGR